jgi:hypothetical protein
MYYGITEKGIPSLARDELPGDHEEKEDEDNTTITRTLRKRHPPSK